MRKTTDYSQDYPNGAICKGCHQFCRVIPHQNHFNYSGTHCTHGLGGTHYPQDWGSPVSDCCELAAIKLEGEGMNIIDMLDEEGPHMRALAVSDVLANMEEGDEQIFYEFISGEALEKVGKLVDRFRRECFPQEFTKANWEAA